jgi:predicted ArsR family transcriptional regulator
MAIETVAEALGLSVNTVRFHLDRFVPGRNGHPSVDPARRSGASHLAYRAVAAEAVDEAATYRLPAGLLAEGVVRSGNTTATVEAGRSWAGRLVGAHAPSVGADCATDANVAAVSRIVELPRTAASRRNSCPTRRPSCCTHAPSWAPRPGASRTGSRPIGSG